MSSPSPVVAFCTRHYRVLAAAVLALAAFNLTFRLGSESVNEWDESLYAISAWEMESTGNLVATTFLGAIDYYNTKPPLNVWLIALSFKAFGISLVSLRLVSVISAWLTIAVLIDWSRRSFGPAVALFAGVVLATTFGFVYVHSGRSADTDAFFTLLILLTVVTLWTEQRHPWRRLWLGPLTAAVFLLRGTAVLMPLAIILAVWSGRKRLHRVPVAGHRGGGAVVHRTGGRVGDRPLAIRWLAILRSDGELRFRRPQSDGHRRASRRAALLSEYPAEASLRLAAGRHGRAAAVSGAVAAVARTLPFRSGTATMDWVCCSGRGRA